jgi:hypothetical protein
MRPITLGELGSAALMERTDHKYVLPLALLPDFLAACAPWYRVLDMDGVRQARYHTAYYDTPELAFYRAHLTGQSARRKLRVRTYADSALSFLEVKHRDNHGRTSKARVPVPAMTDTDAAPLDHLARLPAALAGDLRGADLRRVVASSYRRVTLVDAGCAERVTVDCDLAFAGDGRAAGYPTLVCVELKQPGRMPSAAREALRQLRVRPGPLSKYCVGVASVMPEVRANRLKPLLTRLTRLDRNELAAAVIR